ncbi:carboxypeptidase regulatory-like domain-containing protein [Nocardioides immobilis]|uniref:Carboxypeptidase regulatory-like domain-containing protein n=1 Tax=Nocardioides immobilis TaxID=2049295 RepID=A0A417XYX7_9ACTN|nr:carboxypeptidase-like regulatory domain-containing protein [Nocardioides immobilis]RHW25572.1 carboxypeptidase regulatory-like domain-containing protein [Nocardioides immobilis]
MSRGLRAGRASISGVALVLALLLSLLPPFLAAAPAQAAGGTLRGTLTGPSGSPVEYFQVDVYKAASGDTWQLETSKTVTSWDSGLPVGEFTVALPAGSYRACFHKLGFESDDFTGRRCWSDGLDVFGGTDIAISEGGTTTINPVLPRESQVRGRVAGAGGIGVSAYVMPYRRGPDGNWTAVWGQQSIASDGSFVIDDLDPGTYRFCLADVPREYQPECWDNVATLTEATELVVPPGTRPAIYFRLARRANISGTVTRPRGSTESLTIVTHRFRNAGWEQVAYAGVAADGSYRVTGLDADTYRVCVVGFDIVTTCWRTGSTASGATDIVLATGQYKGNVNLAPGPAGFVTGTLPEVYLGAQGYPNVTAWREVDGSWVGVSTGEAVPTGIGSDWTYRIGSLPTGSYVVCVEHAEPEFVPAFPRTCVGDSPTAQGGIPVAVVAGATTDGVDIRTNRAGEIRGTVNGASGPVRVDLYTASDRLALSLMTNATGFYRIRELPAGVYRIGIHRDRATTSLAAEWYRNRLDSAGLAGATPVPVNGDIVTGIGGTLDPGGAITGRLVDGTGAPVAGCLVKALGRGGTLAVRLARTDASGAFSIGGLSTAPYLVLVSERCSGAGVGLFYDAASPTRTTAHPRNADDVSVTRGLTTTLPADLVTGPPPP